MARVVLSSAINLQLGGLLRATLDSDATNLGQVNDLILGEATARMLADTALGNRIDVLDSELTSRVDSEVRHLLATDSELRAAIVDLIGADIVHRDDLDSETRARIAADSELAARIDSDSIVINNNRLTLGSHQGLIAGLRTDLDAEITRSTDSDQAHRRDIDVNAAGIQSNLNDINNINNTLNDHETRITTNTNNIATNTADIATNTANITANDQDITNLGTRITNEQQAREAADTTLQNNITQEGNARNQAVQAIQTQVTNNDADIANLNARINELLDSDSEILVLIENNTQYTTRIDSESRVRDNDIIARLDSEILSRLMADSELHGRIDSEALARFLKDSELNSRIDSEAGSIRRLNQIFENRIDSEIQRLIDSDSDIRRSIQDLVQHILDSDLDVSMRLTQEIADRQAADTALGTRITNEIAAERDARKNRDSELQQEIDNIDVSAGVHLFDSERSGTVNKSDTEFPLDQQWVSGDNTWRQLFGITGNQITSLFGRPLAAADYIDLAAFSFQPYTFSSFAGNRNWDQDYVTTINVSYDNPDDIQSIFVNQVQDFSVTENASVDMPRTVDATRQDPFTRNTGSVTLINTENNWHTTQPTVTASIALENNEGSVSPTQTLQLRWNLPGWSASQAGNYDSNPAFDRIQSSFTVAATFRSSSNYDANITNVTASADASRTPTVSAVTRSGPACHFSVTDVRLGANDVINTLLQGTFTRPTSTGVVANQSRVLTHITQVRTTPVYREWVIYTADGTAAVESDLGILVDTGYPTASTTIPAVGGTITVTNPSATNAMFANFITRDTISSFTDTSVNLTVNHSSSTITLGQTNPSFRVSYNVYSVTLAAGATNTFRIG